MGLPAFALVIFAAPTESIAMFRTGVVLIGFGSGLFSVGMLVTAMSFQNSRMSGLILGTWGAVQATATGAAMALGEVALYLNLSYVHPDPPAVTRGQTIGGEPAGFGRAD